MGRWALWGGGKGREAPNLFLVTSVSPWGRMNGAGRGQALAGAAVPQDTLLLASVSLSSRATSDTKPLQPVSGSGRDHTAREESEGVIRTPRDPLLPGDTVWVEGGWGACRAPNARLDQGRKTVVSPKLPKSVLLPACLVWGLKGLGAPIAQALGF